MTTVTKLKEYLNLYQITLNEKQLEQIRHLTDKFSEDELNSILDKIDFSSKNFLNELKKICRNDGLTDTDLYYKAMAIIGDLMHLCKDSYCDLVFADVRACIAFKLIFDSFDRFYERDTDKDLMLSEKFSKCYCSVDPSLFLELIKNNYLQQGDITSNCRIRKVIFVGKSEDCSSMCDQFYGAGNWEQITQKFKLKYQKPLPPAQQKTKEQIEREKQVMSNNFETAFKQLDGVLGKTR